MSLKRKTPSPLNLKASKRQHVDNFDFGLISPPNTPSERKLRVRKINNSTTRVSSSQRIASKLQQFTPITPPQSSSLCNESESEEEIVEITIHNKENIAPGVFSEEDLRLIAEVEAEDAKNEIEEPEYNAFKESIYTKTKKLFSKAVDMKTPDDYCLSGREREFGQVENFINTTLKNQTSDFLYISGPPGCGKTQQLTYILEKFMKSCDSSNCFNHELAGQVEKITVTKINCMRINSINNIFDEFLANFKIFTNNIKSYPKYLKIKEKLDSQTLFKHLISNREFSNNNIFLLDELDAILINCKSTHEKQVIFDFFSLARSSQDSDSRLTLIGIANSLNLIDKLAPRLKLNGCQPKTIQFLPYSVEQIINIVKAKLQSVSAVPIVNNSDLPIISYSALQLCAKKSASNTGDLRKVLDILYKSIELVENNIKKQHLSNPDKNLNQYYAISSLTAPKVSIAHVAKVCSNSLNGVSSSNRLKSINLYQCLTLICLAKFEQKKSEDALVSKNKRILQTSNENFNNQLLGSKLISNSNVLSNNKNNTHHLNKRLIQNTINITELYTYYKKLVKKHPGLSSSLSKPEFTEIISTLHTIGLVNVFNKGNNFNINSETSLSCCGIGLADLNKFTESKFEILKTLLNVKL